MHSGHLAFTLVTNQDPGGKPRAGRLLPFTAWWVLLSREVPRGSREFPGLGLGTWSPAPRLWVGSWNHKEESHLDLGTARLCWAPLRIRNAQIVSILWIHRLRLREAE